MKTAAADDMKLVTGTQTAKEQEKPAHTGGLLVFQHLRPKSRYPASVQIVQAMLQLFLPLRILLRRNQLFQNRDLRHIQCLRC